MEEVERKSCDIPMERVIEWIMLLRHRAIRTHLDDPIRAFLWDMATVMAEELPAALRTLAE